MRIAHFVHRYPPALGGSEAFFARLSRHLAGRGDDVTVFTTTALDLEAFWSPRGRTLPAGVSRVDGVTVRRYAPRHWPGRRYLLKLLSFVPVRPLQCLALPCNPVAPEMWRAAGRRRGFDVVHATAFPYAWPLLCGLRLARRCGVPFVLTPFLHLGDPTDPHDRTRRTYLAPPMQYLLRAADRVFVQTPVERQALLDVGLAPERLELLGMGVAAEECTGGDRAAARRQWGLRPDEVVIGHLANKSAEKGTIDLCRAAAALAGAGVPWRLLLAGPEMANFRQFWERQGDTSRIVRLGVLTEAEKRAFYAAIDVFALPSRSDSFGLVFLEAWANGVPCVAYRAGGVADVIRHGRDGLLADCGDVAGLAEDLGRLLADPPLRQNLGQAGQRRVGRELAWGPKLDRVRQVYAEVTAGRQAPASASASSSRTVASVSSS